jgi:hypothetical protein
MNMTGIPFGTTEWQRIGVEERAGELHTDLADGRRFVLKPGMRYQVADNGEPHRSSAPAGARLFVVD